MNKNSESTPSSDPEPKGSDAGARLSSFPGRHIEAGNGQTGHDWFESHYYRLPIPTYLWRQQEDDFVLLSFNDAATRITVGKIAGFVGWKASRMYHDQPHIIADLFQCRRTKDVLTKELEYKFRTTDEKRALSVIYVPLEPDFVVVHTHDITDLKQAQQELLESEQKYKVLVEMFPHAIAIFQDHRVVFANAAAAGILGYGNVSDVMGMDVLAPAQERETKRLEEYLNRHMNDDPGAPDRFQAHLKRADGSEFPAEAFANKTVFGGRPALQVVVMDITEREHAQEALKDSERRFHEFFEHSSSGYVLCEIVTDDQGKPVDYIYLEVNKAFENISQKKACDIVGKRITEVYKELDVTELIEIGGRVALSGNPDHRERLSLSTGRYLEMVHYSPRPGLFAAVINDITERKKADQALKESEERHRAIWESSPIGICLTDRHGVYHYVNKAYCDIYGYDKDELLGRSFFELIMPSNHPRADRKSYAAKFDNPRPVPLSEAEIFVKKDGEPVVIQYSADYICQNNVAVYEVSMNIDITEKKITIEALRESEEKYRLLIENAGEVIATVDKNGRFLVLNKAAARYLGGAPQDFVGKTLRDVFPEEMADFFISRIAQVTATGTSLTEENRMTLQGEARWFKTNLQPVVRSGEEITSALIIADDITGEKIDEVRNEARLKFLERLRKARSIDESLAAGCQAFFDAQLFRRAVLTMHDENRIITHLGQVGLDSEIVRRAREAPPPDIETANKMTQEKYRISHSFFIPVEDGIFQQGVSRQVPQAETSSNVHGTWMPGDELFVPVVGNNGEYEGWLSVDTPFDVKRPSLESILFLEQILVITSKQVHEMQSLEMLRVESLALKEKNIALREILSHIEEDKAELRHKIGANVSQVLIPTLNKLARRDGSINQTYLKLLRAGLHDLVEASSATPLLYSKLSPREREISDLIKNGISSKEIAAALNIALATVRKHRELIRRKLGISGKNINLTNYLKGS